MLRALQERFPEELMTTVVHESVRIAEAPTYGIPIDQYDPKGTGAAEYSAVAAELAQRGMTSDAP